VNKSFAVILTFLLSAALPMEAPSQDASYNRFGSGCAGSAGVPSLDADAHSLPMLGRTFRAQLSNVPDGSYWNARVLSEKSTDRNQ